MIITSMNLYEFSERNNREIGLLIEKEKDHEIFSDALKEIESIKNSSIRQKSFTKESTLKDTSWDLDPNYNELWNFHLPKLKSILEESYQQNEIFFSNGQIRVNDFPRKGIDMVINGRINFLVNNRNYYDELKERKREEIIDKLSPARCYWNYKQINIWKN